MQTQPNLKLVKLLPNGSCIQVLEAALQKAKSGELHAVAIAGILGDGYISTAYSSNQNAIGLMGAVQVLNNRLLDLFKVP